MLGGVEDGGRVLHQGQSASVISDLRVLHKWEVS